MLQKNIEKEERKKRRTWGGYYTRKTPTKKEKLEKNYITGLKLDPSFNETSFATEYLSLWQGAS